MKKGDSLVDILCGSAWRDNATTQGCAFECCAPRRGCDVDVDFMSGFALLSDRELAQLWYREHPQV